MDYTEMMTGKKAWKARAQAFADRDLELLERLELPHAVEGDGGTGQKYIIKVRTNRGDLVTVDWWTNTGRWMVRETNAAGVGLHRMARYFNLSGAGEA